jgi:predicted enzyme involved in methoxymalonyl-ACP biosynthesis
MSCRVLKRGMEDFVLNTIAAAAIASGCTQLKGEYLPTAKNELVKNHYDKLGFEKAGDYWLLHLGAYTNRSCFIRQMETGYEKR